MGFARKCALIVVVVGTERTFGRVKQLGVIYNYTRECSLKPKRRTNADDSGRMEAARSLVCLRFDRANARAKKTVLPGPLEQVSTL